MSGYADMFFTHLLDYFNLLWQNELIKYFCSFFIVLVVLGLLRKLLKVNN